MQRKKEAKKEATKKRRKRKKKAKRKKWYRLGYSRRRGGSSEGHPAPLYRLRRAFLLCLRRAGPRARVRHHCMPENMDRLDRH